MFNDYDDRMIACVTDPIFFIRRLKINHKTCLGIYMHFVLEISTVANNMHMLMGMNMNMNMREMNAYYS